MLFLYKHALPLFYAPPQPPWKSGMRREFIIQAAFGKVRGLRARDGMFNNHFENKAKRQGSWLLSFCWLERGFFEPKIFSRASLQCDCQVAKRAGIQAKQRFLGVFI